MRKIPALLAVLGLAAVGLVGCSASAPAAASCSRQVAADPSTTDLITVKGAVGKAPDVSVYSPFHTDKTVFEDLKRGKGTAITDLDHQQVVLDVSFSAGSTGETLVQTPYDGDMSRVFSASRWVESFPGFKHALDCATEGSRILVALAPNGVEAQTASGLGLAAGESAVAVVDVRKVFLTHADGADQYNDAHNLPTVVRASNGRPGIIVPDATPPKNVVVQTIKKGDGPAVTGDDPLLVHYTGVTWADRTVFDTTWDGDPKTIAFDGSDEAPMLPAFLDALKGKTVGSQVLIVIPPSKGYGKEQQGAIAANSTLVYVVDILGTTEVAPATAQ